MRILVFVLLLAFPAVAHAVDGTGLSVVAPPWHGDCEYQARVTDGGHEQALRRKRKHLYEGDAKGAWKDLRDYGPDGARLIGEWLDDGAPGVDDRHRRDAGLHLFRCGSPVEVEIAARQVDWGSSKAVRSMLRALQGRVPRFTPEQAAHLATAPDEAVQIEAVKALIGSYKIKKSTGFAIFFIAITRTVDVKAAKTEPPAHHVEAVKALLEENPVDVVWHPAVKAIGTLYSYEIPEQDAWFPILLAAVQRPELDEDGKIGRAASLFIGRGLPDRMLEGALTVLESGLTDNHVSLVAGFEDAMQDGRSHPDLEQALEIFAEQGLGTSALEARQLLRAARRR